MVIRIPEQVRFILRRLNEAGHTAYAVGGCVRDSLLGREPKDWDICSSARPDELSRLFADRHVVETGLQHGTLTVVLDHVPYEVTTYRLDGEYTDHRHPDGVTFVTDVREDLSRRDFTVNAMAYHPQEGVIDAFGGQADLAARLIRCVGDPDKRFGEDALRILRALRFASVYDFTIEPATAAAIHRLYPTLSGVAAERVRAELGKLLCGAGVERILRQFADVITFVIPELSPSVGFAQHTPYHRYDVWEHTIRAVANVPPQEVLRLTMLLHDSGKPACFTMDEQGVGHAYGHQQVSRDLAETVLDRLRMDNSTRDRVLLLVAHHDMPLSAEGPALKRRLNRFGEEALRQLIEVQRADNCSKGTLDPAAVCAWADSLIAALDALLATSPCVTLRDLAVNGGDLLRCGCPKGPRMGECLRFLLDRVLDDELPNDRDVLLTAAAQWLSQKN